VMEASQGQRFLLFDTTALPGGIADVTASLPGEHDTIWSWDPILPSDPSWTGGSTVNNGFSINALPLSLDGGQETWYFHIVSTVTQATRRRRGLATTTVNQHIVRATSKPSSSLQGVAITSSSANDASSLTPPFSLLLGYLN